MQDPLSRPPVREAAIPTGRGNQLVTAGRAARRGRRPSRSYPPPGTSTGPTASVDGAAGASHRGVSTDEAPAASTIGADSGRGSAGKVTSTPTDPLGGGPHQFCHTNRTSADCPGSTSTVVCDKHPVAA